MENSSLPSLLELPSLLRPCLFWRSHTYQHCLPFQTPPACTPPLCYLNHLAPRLTVQHSHRIFAFKPLITVGVNILLNNSFRFFFPIFMLPLFALLHSMAEVTSFLSIFSFSRNLFLLGNFNCHHPALGLVRFFRPPWWKVFHWVISFLSMTATYLFFFVAPLPVALSLTSPLLPLFMLMGGASEPGF